MKDVTKREANYLKGKGWENYIHTSSSGKRKQYWIVENPQCLKALKEYQDSHTVLTVKG